MADVQFHHISLTCADPVATERFYTRHFGFVRSRVVALDPGNQIVFLRGAGTHLELFKATEKAPVSPPQNDGYPWPSVRNFSFLVSDVDAQIRAMGSDARIAFGPLDFGSFISGWRSVWVRDPDGYLVQITQGYVDAETAPAPLPEV